MPLFAPPIYKPSRRPIQDSISHEASSSPSKKRKRHHTPASTSPSSSSSEDDDDTDSRSLYAASTNPLSLTPDEIIQYRLAGLDLDEVLPSQRIKGFPHRGLPGHVLFHEKVRRVRTKRKGKGKGKERGSQLLESENDGEGEDEDDDEDGEEEEDEGMVDIFKQNEEEDEFEPEDTTAAPVRQGSGRRRRGNRLRRHHLGVLTTLLHRCLAEGDIPRASRAWALLLRAESGGFPIDIRNTGYWGIGAELLIRGQESNAAAFGGQRRESSPGDGDTNEDAAQAEEDQDPESDSENASRPIRWGTAEGLEKAKEYYERLILQYPYMRQFPNAVTAVDFWPAMLGCEIYGIQFSQKEALWKISRAEEKDEGSGDDDDDGDDEEVLYEEDEEAAENNEDSEYSYRERRRQRRLARRAEKRWRQREEVRRTALEASETVANRMDELMTSLPYSDSHALLRLRGMLALYIGDLCVPSAPRRDSLDEDQEQVDTGTDTTQRLLRRQRELERQRGLGRQEEERERARVLFQRIADEGGDIGGDVQDIVSAANAYDAFDDNYDEED